MAWFQDGESIDDFSWPRYRVRKNYLKIKSADQEDSGIYECKGVNGFGTMQAQLQLIVTGKKFILFTFEFAKFYRLNM